MKIIKLKKNSFLKILFKRFFYFFINFFYFFNKKKIYLSLNNKIKIKIDNYINKKFIYQNNNKVKLINSNLFIYEEEESLKIISNSSKNHIFVDIGSHHGYFSFISQNYFKKIYSVELSNIFLENQKKISKYNNIKNIKFFNYAIFDGISKISYTDYIKTYKSQTITLINFLSMKNLNREKLFLKIDVNGFEIPLLNDVKKIYKNVDYLLVDIYLNFLDLSKDKSLLLSLLDLYINAEVLTHTKKSSNKFTFIDKKSFQDLLLNDKHSILTLFLSKNY